jgi:hypothetical protein
MNLRRGSFRIWLVLSVFFIAGVGALSYEKVAGEFEKASQDWSQAGTLLVPMDCREARGAPKTDYTPPDGPWNDYAAVKGCWYKLPDFRRLYLEYRDLSDSAVADKLYAKANITLSPAKPWEALGIAVAVALGAPILVLLVGAALGWALSGFFTSKQNK